MTEQLELAKEVLLRKIKSEVKDQDDSHFSTKTEMLKGGRSEVEVHRLRIFRHGTEFTSFVLRLYSTEQASHAKAEHDRALQVLSAQVQIFPPVISIEELLDSGIVAYADTGALTASEVRDMASSLCDVIRRATDDNFNRLATGFRNTLADLRSTFNKLKKDEIPSAVTFRDLMSRQCHRLCPAYVFNGDLFSLVSLDNLVVKNSDSRHYVDIQSLRNIYDSPPGANVSVLLTVGSATGDRIVCYDNESISLWIKNPNVSLEKGHQFRLTAHKDIFASSNSQLILAGLGLAAEAYIDSREMLHVGLDIENLTALLPCHGDLHLGNLTFSILTTEDVWVPNLRIIDYASYEEGSYLSDLARLEVSFLYAALFEKSVFTQGLSQLTLLSALNYDKNALEELNSNSFALRVTSIVQSIRRGYLEPEHERQYSTSAVHAFAYCIELSKHQRYMLEESRHIGDLYSGYSSYWKSRLMEVYRSERRRNQQLYNRQTNADESISLADSLVEIATLCFAPLFKFGMADIGQHKIFTDMKKAFESYCESHDVMENTLTRVGVRHLIARTDTIRALVSAIPSDDLRTVAFNIGKSAGIDLCSHLGGSIASIDEFLDEWLKWDRSGGWSEIQRRPNNRYDQFIELQIVDDPFAACDQKTIRSFWEEYCKGLFMEGCKHLGILEIKSSFDGLRDTTLQVIRPVEVSIVNSDNIANRLVRIKIESEKLEGIRNAGKEALFSVSRGDNGDLQRKLKSFKEAIMFTLRVLNDRADDEQIIESYFQWQMGDVDIAKKSRSVVLERVLSQFNRWVYAYSN